MAHAHAKNVHTVIKIWLQMLNFHLPSTYLTYLQKVPNHDTQSYSVCYLNKSSKWQKRQMHGTSELGEWVTSLFIYLRYGRKDTVMRNAHIFISIFLVFSLPYVYGVWRTKYICSRMCCATWYEGCKSFSSLQHFVLGLGRSCFFRPRPNPGHKYFVSS